MDANAASLALILDGKVLLIRRARPPYEGFWTLPGGKMEAGETPADCARREVVEELGIGSDGLVPVTEVEAGDAKRHFVIAVFASSRFSGTVSPSEEVADWGWYAPGEIGRLRTTPDLGYVFSQLTKHIDICQPH